MSAAIFSLAALLFGSECSAILQRAQLAYDTRKFDTAATEFNRGLEVCPTSSSVLRGLAQSQLMLQRFDASVATLDRWLGTEPRSTDALKLKADALYLMGKDQAAEQALVRALEIDAGHRSARYALGRMYYQQHRYVEAAEQLKKVVEQDGADYRAHDNLALVYEALGEDGKALHHYLRALELVHKDHPEYDWAYSNLANFMLRRGEYDKAFQLALEASKRNPTSARNLFLTAKALQKLGKLEQSVRWLEQSIKIDPAYAEARYVLAQTYRKMGLADKAARELAVFRDLSKTPKSKR